MFRLLEFNISIKECILKCSSVCPTLSNNDKWYPSKQNLSHRICKIGGVANAYFLEIDLVHE